MTPPRSAIKQMTKLNTKNASQQGKKKKVAGKTIMTAQMATKANPIPKPDKRKI